jgi:hypothetical protein
MQRQFLCHLFIRYLQAHEIQTHYPDFQRLMRSRKDGVGQIIKALVTVVTRIALTGGFRVIKAALDGMFGLTRGADDTVWPASCADRLKALSLINQIRDVDLQCGTPVRG